MDFWFCEHFEIETCFGIDACFYEYEQECVLISSGGNELPGECTFLST